MTLLKPFVLLIFISFFCQAVFMTPSHACELLKLSRHDKTEQVEICLKETPPSNIDVRTSRGDTPLLIAARRGNLDMIRLLAKFGADISAQDNMQRDILNIAISNQNPQLARLALELNADATATTSIYNGSALIYGSAKGQVEIVKMLIKAGAPVNRVNNIGWTALLETAILGDGSEKYIAIAKALLGAGADPSIKDKKNITALEHAYKRGHLNLAKAIEAFQ